ncbi:MAG: hypothetical protein WC052_03400 [Patescibacteria group bacterium]|jgi:hypothetical protein
MDSHLRAVDQHVVPVVATVHYYGDIVRRLFIAIAITLTIVSPFVVSLLPVSAFAISLIVLALILLAGLTNPLQRWIIATDFVVSAAGVYSFVYVSATSYAAVALSNTHLAFFVASHFIAFLFAFALYYSSKSFRGLFFDLPERPEYVRRRGPE